MLLKNGVNVFNFEPKICKHDCPATIKIEKKTCHHFQVGFAGESKKRQSHISQVSEVGGGSNRLDRYRIPAKLINDFFEVMVF